MPFCASRPQPALRYASYEVISDCSRYLCISDLGVRMYFWMLLKTLECPAVGFGCLGPAGKQTGAVLRSSLYSTEESNCINPL